MKVSYFKKWDRNGTFYNQGIRITEREFIRLSDSVYAERVRDFPRWKDYIPSGDEFNKVYLKNLYNNREGNICFTNHTQRNFVNLFLKLKLLDRNTYLIVV